MAEVGDQGRQRELACIEAMFHGLIRSRCREGGIAEPEELPLIAALVTGSEGYCFPVPGMNCGFWYRMDKRDGEWNLVSDSWSPVKGSGMRHRITSKQVLLVHEGMSLSLMAHSSRD